MVFRFIVSANGDEDPPVPIPNTEVKLISAENTWLEAARENRAVPTQKELSEKCAFKHIFHLSHLLLTFYLLPITSYFKIYSSLAQSVERAAVNRVVVGSSPTGGAKKHSFS